MVPSSKANKKHGIQVKVKKNKYNIDTDGQYSDGHGGPGFMSPTALGSKSRFNTIGDFEDSEKRNNIIQK